MPPGLGRDGSCGALSAASTTARSVSTPEDMMAVPYGQKAALTMSAVGSFTPSSTDRTSGT